MRFLRTKRFKKEFARLPSEIQQRAAKSLELFAGNPRHPSLHVKKMEGAPGIWELRVTDNYRMTFQRFEGGVLLRRVGTHNVLRQP
jgi:mRNA-degrading endonuclease RelE of RelBE toxin-antitoxin system